LGSTVLLRAIKNYVSKNNKDETAKVGVMGFPNVGKKSLIKSLASYSKSEPTEEGIVLDTNIILLENPATLIASPFSKKMKGIVRNAMDLKYVMEPLSPIKFILDTCSKAQILQLYKIPDYNDHVHFLTILATHRDKAKKNDDIGIIAREVYEDWLSGKIPYYTEPPEESPEDVTNEWAEIYNLKQLINMEQKTVFDKHYVKIQKLMLASVIKPIRVFIHPGWKVIDRENDDPLEDIKEDLTRKKQKQGKKKQQRKAKIGEAQYNSRKKSKKTPRPRDDTYSFETDFVTTQQ